MSTPAGVPSSLDRAIAAGNWPARRPDGTFAVASSSRPGVDHHVSPDGASCTCEAGRHGVPDCLHRAAVRWCLARRVWAAHVLCANCRGERVARRGDWCPGCAAVARAWAEDYRADVAHHRVPSVARAC